MADECRREGLPGTGTEAEQPQDLTVRDTRYHG